MIQTDDVAALVRHILFKTPDTGFFSSQIDVLKSGFDVLGLHYTPLKKNGLSILDLQNMCYREIGRLFIYPHYAPEVSAGHDFYYDYSGDTTASVKPEIGKIIRQAEILMRLFYDHPEALACIRLNDDLKFWHPWVDCYFELQQYCCNTDIDKKKASRTFLSGLDAGTGFLKRFALN